MIWIMYIIIGAVIVYSTYRLLSIWVGFKKAEQDFWNAVEEEQKCRDGFHWGTKDGCWCEQERMKKEKSDG